MNPLTPATLAFNTEGALYSPEYDDIYASAAGARGQAEHVFVAGSELPERWQRRPLFTILETGFGAGVNFLSVWRQWQADPARCERLHFVSVEKHPFTAESLRAAHAHTGDARFDALVEQLCSAWPPAVPGLHRLEFEQGRVTLTLALGDAAQVLPGLRLRADAIFLDGFAPAKNPDIWTTAIFKNLARLAAPDATLATYTSVGAVRRGLQAAGFDVARAPGYRGKLHMLAGRFAPRWRVRRYEPLAPGAWRQRHAIVVGAGLAGCAIVERLASRGWRATLLERGSAVAGAASGNPAGVFHPLISRDDSVAARWLRAGFLYALTRWRELERAGHRFPWRADGLLQVADEADPGAPEAMRAALADLRLPPELARWVGTGEAASLAGVPVAHGGLFFPAGGWVDPAGLCRAQLAAAGNRVDLRLNTAVSRLVPHDGGWAALDHADTMLVSAEVVILANARDAALLAPGYRPPTIDVRGQLTMLPEGTLPGLRLPVIGSGYLVPLPDGRRLTGASYDVGDLDPESRGASALDNLQRLARLLPGFAAPAGDPAQFAGRVAFRCVTSDRMPFIGRFPDLADASLSANVRHGAHLRDLSRPPGLFAAFAYGSRGLLWAALGAEMLVCELEGEPLPVGQDLIDSVDPARFLLRDLRRGAAGPSETSPGPLPVHNQG